MTVDVKVTPTEVDAIAAAELIEAYWHDSDASMMKLAASYRAGHRQGVFIRAMTAARLQGWNECREAAAGWHEAQAEEHASHQVSAERLGAHISAQAHETRRHQHMRDAALIRNLTPSTPES